MKLIQIIYGIATFIPGVYNLLKKGTGGTNSARYCYSVWMRHIVSAKNNGLNPHPAIVAELGPGDSLGIGLAALISGSEQYYAFDVVEFANIERNLEIFDELVVLFQERTPIPGDNEFPNVKPYLDIYDFPNDIFTEKKISRALEKSRLARIRDSIVNYKRNDSQIRYMVPWSDTNVLKQESVDMIYSQAVLEHVDDLDNTYKAMRLWLKPDGFISHQIDFKCHGTADEWNGHWAYSDFMWKLIKGGRTYLLNREPHSTHIAILKKEGYILVCDKKFELKSNLKKSMLAPRFRSISDEDLQISGVFIQAAKGK